MKQNNKEIEVETLDKNNKIDVKKIILIITSSIFIILTVLILTKVTDKIDNNIQSYIIGIRNDNLTNTMKIFTNIGGAYFLTALSIILLAILKNKKISLLIIINLICVFITSQIFKIIIRRDRPMNIFLTNENGYSYPSGHAMVSIAFYTFIAYLLCKKINNNLFKAIIIIITALLIIIIGISRIYLGVHHFTDIIGGYLLGITYLMIYIKIIEKKSEVKN